MCEDYPCCGHEAGDCEGKLYGSDEAIMQAEYNRLKRADWDDYYDED
jgi:hypothetical protein